MEKEKVVNIVVEAIDYLLGADLREENGWTEDTINKLEELKKGEFILINKSEFEEKNPIKHVCKCGSLNTDIVSVSEAVTEHNGKKISVAEINYICNDCGSGQIDTRYLYKLKPNSEKTAVVDIDEFVKNNNDMEALIRLKEAINKSIDTKIIEIEENRK